MKKGYVSLILHSHMPFVRHPELEDALEERWLFEAMSECYIPLINVYDNLIKDNIKFKITMSITPPLMSMLEDEYVNKRYLNYLLQSIELSEKEISRTKHDNEVNKLARFYNNRFKNILKIYKSYDERIMNAFKKFDKLGNLEILTCSATHALLPLLTINPETIKAQIATAVESYTKYIGHAPRGIWLPECAYTYELDDVLKKYGIKYFISESTAVLDSVPKPKYGTYTPIKTSNDIYVFGRDIESSQQVWSSFRGYPGDYNYREFYRDIGYEAPMEYIAPYINRSGIRIDTGIKYHKITGKTEDKLYYNRDEAMKKIKNHAGHFADTRNKQLEQISANMDVNPIIVCPYDTELYGHWWFEGPNFIDEFIRMSAEEWTKYKLITPWDYLKKNSKIQLAKPNPSSWGANNDFSVWLNQSNHWIYRYIHKCERKMTQLSNTYKDPSEILKRALNQAARELMLAESSDWPFIINNNTTVEYAVKRIKSHINRFNKIYDDISKNTIDVDWLKNIENLDNIFPDIDYAVYAS